MACMILRLAEMDGFAPVPLRDRIPPAGAHGGVHLYVSGEGGWSSDGHLQLPGTPPLLILPDNASRKEVLAILTEKLDGKET